VSDVELGAGTKIDRYEIVRSVARGGMGHVWLARFGGKHGFEKLVAIKTVLPELAVSPQFRAMLLDEARICSRLHHANVAQILDVGELGDVPYVVFEWVEGAPLEALCVAAEDRGAKIALGPLLRVMADVCSGLHAAHELTDERGERLSVVHRDVSPNNIIVSKKGFAKLIDFGVAKARDRLAGETKSGIVKGTPQYMAPEQARGDKTDRRSDVWAAGAVFYRALDGAPPFKDRIALESFILKRAELDPLSTKIPREVREIVERAMQRDPAARFQTAEEMRFAIERAIGMSDRSSSIADLFAPETPATLPQTELPTSPEDIALARTATAIPASEAPPPNEPTEEVSKLATTLPSERPIAPPSSQANDASSRAKRGTPDGANDLSSRAKRGTPDPSSRANDPSSRAQTTTVRSADSSRSLKIALAVAVAVAVAAILALVWSLART
jgi:serine/threonine-protein kinase